MRALLQRVTQASVHSEGKLLGSISRGFVLLLGINENDTEAEVLCLAEKICNLRVFTDSQGKMNLSLQDICGEILLVSQFTLYADCRKGRRPGFTEAARPEHAIPLYEKFLEILKNNPQLNKVACGKFGADMQVSLCNDGPVTIHLDSDDLNVKK